MQILTLILVLFVSIVSGCNKNDKPLYPYEAKVVGVNIDCGEYEIQFISGLPEIKEFIGDSPIDGFYIAKNLTEEFKVAGLIIKLDCRKPAPKEFGGCT
jgi:hypothetical protein